MYPSLRACLILEAIHNDELRLEFQPVVSRRPMTLKKLEALVRWEHPTIGCIPPDDFLPTAEADPEVIDALTGWVVGAALRAYHTSRPIRPSVLPTVVW
jgi:EAL domain-containing protein (putative c-di-GMP-specific phosphodiesterase class I)